MGDTSYIYGENNGQIYAKRDHDEAFPHGVQWDRRLSIRAVATGLVEVGIIPPSATESTDTQGVWNVEDGQFLTMSRDGLNRLIVAAREARDAAFGRDE